MNSKRKRIRVVNFSWTSFVEENNRWKFGYGVSLPAFELCERPEKVPGYGGDQFLAFFCRLLNGYGRAYERYYPPISVFLGQFELSDLQFADIRFGRGWTRSYVNGSMVDISRGHRGHRPLARKNVEVWCKVLGH